MPRTGTENPDPQGRLNATGKIIIFMLPKILEKKIEKQLEALLI